MQKLTRAEEELMQVLWKLEKGFLKEIMGALPEPRPAQSTVSTILKILQTKGFVAHQAFGKSYQYYPLIGKNDYAKAYFGSFLERYFGGSAKRMLSFFVEQEDIDLSTLDEVLKARQDAENEDSTQNTDE